MRIWKLEGADCDRLLRKLERHEDDKRPIRYVRIGVDGDSLKVKVNEFEWSAPLGTLEVDKPEPVEQMET